MKHLAPVAFLLALALLPAGCHKSASSGFTDLDASTDADSDTDVDTDSGSDSDTDSDSDGDSDTGSSTEVADECYEGTITIYDQEDAEVAWPYPCVTGNLWILASVLSSLSLPNLEWVGESVRVTYGNEQLQMLDLSGLVEVGEDVELTTTELAEVDAPLLAGVGGDLDVSIAGPLDLPALSTVGGFVRLDAGGDIALPGLNWVGGNFNVYCYAATSVEFEVSAPNLTVIGGGITLDYCPGLGSTDLFQSLVSLGGGVHIHATSLAGLDGPGALEVTGGTIELFYNVELTSMSAFSGLTAIDGALEIVGNVSLADLDDLASLTSVGEGLAVNENEQLPYCEVCQLLDQLVEPPLELGCVENLDDACTPVPDNCP